MVVTLIFIFLIVNTSRKNKDGGVSNTQFGQINNFVRLVYLLTVLFCESTERAEASNAINKL